MKFTCPKCQTRHQLPDEDLSQGSARVACPSCGHALTLKRRPTAPSEDAAAATATPAAPSTAPAQPQSLAPPAQTPATPAAVLDAMAAAAPPAEAGATPVAQPEADPFFAAPDADAPFPSVGDAYPNGDNPFPAGDALLPGVPVNAAPPPKDAGYFNAPPGRDTQMFMNVAGIYKQRRQRKVAAVAAFVIVAVVGSVMFCDAKGLISLPWLGSLYAKIGVIDPNAGRVIARSEAKLKAGAPLSRAEKNALRRRLMGNGELELENDDVPSTGRHTDAPKYPRPPTGAPVVPTSTSAAQPTPTPPPTDLVDADGKREHVLGLAGDGAAPNLPNGLTQDAIFKVINDNNRSMSLCYGEAARKGEKLRGKMEVQITIDHGGNVTEVSIETAKFSGTTMGDCTMRRVKNWKFPKFSGDAVTVVFPYVLSSSL